MEEASLKASMISRPVNLSLSYLFYVLLRTGVFKGKQQGLCHHILKREKCADWLEYYPLSYRTLKDYLSDESDTGVVEKKTDIFIQKVKRDLRLERYLEKDDLILFDEGLLHHHHGFGPGLLQKYSAKQLSLDKGLDVSGLILCELSFERNMDRILKRKEQGIKTFSHGGKNGTILESFVFRERLEYQLKIEMLKKMGIQILQLDMEDDVIANAEQIIFFMNSLNQVK